MEVETMKATLCGTLSLVSFIEYLPKIKFVESSV